MKDENKKYKLILFRLSLIALVLSIGGFFFYCFEYMTVSNFHFVYLLTFCISILCLVTLLLANASDLYSNNYNTIAKIGISFGYGVLFIALALFILVTKFYTST